MLFNLPPPPANPHAPFVYANGEIRAEIDGALYSADVWYTRDGWRWSASYAADLIDDDTYAVSETTEAPDPLTSESDAVTAAVAWLRRKKEGPS